MVHCRSFGTPSKRLPRAIICSVPIPPEPLAFIFPALNQQRGNCGRIRTIAWLCVITTSPYRACFSVIHDGHLDPWTRPLHVPAPNGGEYLLTNRAIANRLWRPQDYELIPADELDVRGKFVVPRVTREGAGAALVAVRNEQASQVPLRFAPPRVYTAVTALALFSGRKCEIEFIDPLAAQTVNVSGRSLPSQADLTAPIGLGLSREHPEKIGSRRC
jgi:hypothetical protein